MGWWYPVHGRRCWCCRCRKRQCETFELEIQNIDRLMWPPVAEPRWHWCIIFRRLAGSYWQRHLQTALTQMGHTWSTSICGTCQRPDFIALRYLLLHCLVISHNVCRWRESRALPCLIASGPDSQGFSRCHTELLWWIFPLSHWAVVVVWSYILVTSVTREKSTEIFFLISPFVLVTVLPFSTDSTVCCQSVISTVKCWLWHRQQRY